MAIRTGTDANDYFYTYMAADTIDGRGGLDTWEGVYSESAENLTFAYSGLTGAGSLSNGTTLLSIEYGLLQTGEGDDTITLTGNANFQVDGGSGSDLLVRDDSGSSAGNTAYRFLPMEPRLGDGYEGNGGNGSFESINRFDIIMSDADNTTFIELQNAVLGETGLKLDGGVGFDTLTIDATTTWGDLVTLVVDETGAITSNLGTFARFEAFDLTVGGSNVIVTTAGGNDIIRPHPAATSTVSTGGGDDTIYASGTLTADGGTGIDTLQAGGVRSSFTLTREGATGWSLVDLGGSGGSAQFTNIEFIAFSDETLDLSTLANPEPEIVGTANADSLTGGTGDDIIRGLAGGDALRGLAGADLLDGGGGNDVLAGGDGSDVLLGGAGNDKLRGGAGGDRMEGGIGNDVYVVDDLLDQVIEADDAGRDRIDTYVSMSLASGVEDVNLLGEAQFVFGNGLDNVMQGNALNNSLSGSDGDDTLYGLGGNDFLNGGEGDDWLYGGRGDDVLLGGAGENRLVGGAGADKFRFDDFEPAFERDIVEDFEQDIDSIQILRNEFAALAGERAGALDPSVFHRGTEATSPDHHLIYNRANGGIYYDPDGVGGQAHVRIALLWTQPVLDAGDFTLL